MRTIRSILGRVTAIALILTAHPAMACSPNMVVTIPEPNWHDICSRALANPRKYLSSVKGGRQNPDDIADLAARLRNGSDGCPANEGFAYQILDTAVPSPITPAANPMLVNALNLASAGLDIPKERRRDISSAAWLLAPHTAWRLPDGWTEQEWRAFIVQPGRWEKATAASAVIGRPGTPFFDKFLLDILADRSSPRFNLAMAISLASQSPDVAAKAYVAAHLLDSVNGGQYDRQAAALLDWYSPYIDSGVDPEAQASASASWRTLADAMVRKGSGADARRGRAILATGDPRADPNLVDGIVVPRIDRLIVLDAWPASLAQLLPPERLARLFTGDDFPARAMREQAVGPSGAALLFSPDGSFRRVITIHPSGNDLLDAETARVWQRRYRPKFDDMKITGFAGSHVVVPLPVVEWRLSYARSQPSGWDAATHRIIVTAKLYRPELSGTTCWPWP